MPNPVDANFLKLKVLNELKLLVLKSWLIRQLGRDCFCNPVPFGLWVWSGGYLVPAARLHSLPRTQKGLGKGPPL